MTERCKLLGSVVPGSQGEAHHLVWLEGRQQQAAAVIVVLHVKQPWPQTVLGKESLRGPRVHQGRCGTVYNTSSQTLLSTCCNMPAHSVVFTVSSCEGSSAPVHTVVIITVIPKH